MPHDLPKAYEPGAIEPRWAEYWIQEKLFHVDTPSAGSTQPVFTLTLPPPNVTGSLHMGHMLNQTEMDIIVRWHRMRGFITLWLPGTDHAGIATQVMVERQLAAEGKNRRDMTREAFVERVWKWKMPVWRRHPRADEAAGGFGGLVARVLHHGAISCRAQCAKRSCNCTKKD